MSEPHLDLERKLRPLADPLPPPQPGDWLAEHDEPGQTFAEYVDARPVRKSDKLNTIYLCLVGDFNEAQRRILDLTEDYLAIFFDCPVRVRRQIALASIPPRARRTWKRNTDGYANWHVAKSLSRSTVAHHPGSNNSRGH
jgi:archaemetzincin